MPAVNQTAHHCREVYFANAIGYPVEFVIAASPFQWLCKSNVTLDIWLHFDDFSEL